jgi:hypothetical protein
VLFLLIIRSGGKQGSADDAEGAKIAKTRQKTHVGNLLLNFVVLDRVGGFRRQTSGKAAYNAYSSPLQQPPRRS